MFTTWIWYGLDMKRETPIQLTPDAQLKKQLAGLMKKTGLKTRTAVIRLAISEAAEKRGV